jgi:hypothetical protein
VGVPTHIRQLPWCNPQLEVPLTGASHQLSVQADGFIISAHSYRIQNQKMFEVLGAFTWSGTEGMFSAFAYFSMAMR